MVFPLRMARGCSVNGVEMAPTPTACGPLHKVFLLCQPPRTRPSFLQAACRSIKPGDELRLPLRVPDSVAFCHPPDCPCAELSRPCAYQTPCSLPGSGSSSDPSRFGCPKRDQPPPHLPRQHHLPLPPPQDCSAHVLLADLILHTPNIIPQDIRTLLTHSVARTTYYPTSPPAATAPAFHHA